MIDEATLTFAFAHRNDDVPTLLLSNSHNVDIRAAAQQIEGLQRATVKWPSLAANPYYVYPPRINCEQSSSEATAHYKTTIVAPQGRAADLTGGMGIDTSALATTCSTVDYIEQNNDLCELAAHNFATLGLTNITCHNADSLEWIVHHGHFDLILIDPARRDTHGRKMAALSDCTPDITSHIDLLMAHCDNMLIKTSPMIDIDAAIHQLRHIAEVHIVAVKGECKEVLFLCTHTPTTDADRTITCANILPGKNHILQFNRQTEAQSNVRFASSLHTYLYEPNAAIMKGGAFRTIADRYNIEPLARNSHLYTSHTLHNDFPGRIFTIDAQVPLNRTDIHRLIPDGRANIISRNYPERADRLKQRLRLVDGGSTFLIATTLASKPIGITAHLLTP